MNRRNIIIAGMLGLANISFRPKKDQNPKTLIIPESVQAEIAKILKEGGVITGYTYLYPRDSEAAKPYLAGSSGQRYLNEAHGRDWKMS